ncbi:MAG TPA: DUF4446 family protein [Candidatus Limnocylindria bacterium]|nr:DUF4446 family protein [Candidatus Limnocylindria bacterium]
MPELNRLLSDNLGLAFAVMAVLLLILIVLVAIQSARLGRATRAYRALVGGTGGGSLGDVLGAHVSRVDEVAHRLDDLDRLHAFLEERSRGSLQHIGMVRFNPFDDTGSDQSFAIALLDDRRDGVVLSSLHGRSNTRLFAKPVENGESKHALSTEEAQAIKIAVEGTRPIPTTG